MSTPLTALYTDSAPGDRGGSGGADGAAPEVSPVSETRKPEKSKSSPCPWRDAEEPASHECDDGAETGRECVCDGFGGDWYGLLVNGGVILTGAPILLGGA